ncbi:MAG: AAA family ATPase [Candidatus Delongbacteria bacterium]|jgi:predicted AAA+ superfamily ATPase|nr:AAA family ATPase [Candidatus Delongbacteria bacterium]
MKRFFETYLEEWKDRKNRKPLIIRGARQIGKTYTVEEFASNNFSNIVKLNFEELPELKSFFNTNNVTEIRENIEVFFGTKITEGTTLLFFDEIQQCPEAIVSLRYFYEKLPNLHLIAAGSLLDHTLNNMKYSIPVGRIEFAYMHPLNFYEFLIAQGEKQLTEYLNNYSLDKAISLPIHNKLLKLSRLYYFIGGMPEAVKEYSQTKDLISVERIHESILKALEYDFAKYGSKTQQEILITILKYIPAGLGRKIKYVNIDEHHRSDTIKSALKLLEMSRIVHLVKNTKATGIPLEQGCDNKLMKPLFLDIGLGNHILKLRLIDIENLLTINEGSLAEQFIGQQLLTTEPYFLDSQLYYWAREVKSSAAELDFLSESNNRIIPIEVKAGKTGTLKSLQVYMKEKKLETAVRFNTDLPSQVDVIANIRIGQVVEEVRFNLLSLPLYLALEFKRLI